MARLVAVVGVRRRRRLSSVTRLILCNVTHQVAARSGPVVLRPVRATPCLQMLEPIQNQALRLGAH